MKELTKLKFIFLLTIFACTPAREITLPSSGIAVNRSGLVIREGCSQDHRVLKTIPFSHRFTIIEVGPRENVDSFEDHWFQVEYSATKGCVFGLGIYIERKYFGYLSDYYYNLGKNDYDRKKYFSAVLNFEKSLKVYPENYKN
ncbi:MAG: tetratricopeptide repeat protein [Leptospira sp.]|nr:tetratricopeptide repeat protein [Leptospira sp.]NCS94997.1 tetratricopeptide repeat protein [Leptospira sp.]